MTDRIPFLTDPLLAEAISAVKAIYFARVGQDES